MLPREVLALAADAIETNSSSRKDGALEGVEWGVIREITEWQQFISMNNSQS